MSFGQNGIGPCGKRAKWESWARWLLGEMKNGRKRNWATRKRAGQTLGWEWEKGEVGMGKTGKFRAKWDWANWE